MITDFHAKYIAHDLTRRCASDSVEKLTAVLSDAQVDLNPHQIEAALFAFRNPLSRGAILADEVGLGKTIEAGLLIAQKWAEQKHRVLVIVPANLRNGRSGGWKPSEMKRGAPMIRPAGTWTGRRTLCSMKSAAAFSSRRLARRCSRCAGGSNEQD
jgi:SNF2-related domain